MTSITFFLSYKTNRSHVAVRLFSNRSQKTSLFGKNISDTLDYRLLCRYFVFTSFWRRLWSITEQTHGSMGSICLILHSTTADSAMQVYRYLPPLFTPHFLVLQKYFNVYLTICVVAAFNIKWEGPGNKISDARHNCCDVLKLTNAMSLSRFRCWRVSIVTV